MKAIPIDVYDKDGNLTKVETQDTNGDHIADFLWDPNDEQTSEKRVAFRAFVYRFLDQKGYEVDK
jgi:hypothetical protein